MIAEQLLADDPMKLFEDNEVELSAGEEKDSVHSMPSDIVKYIMQVLHFITKSQNSALSRSIPAVSLRLISLLAVSLAALRPSFAAPISGPSPTNGMVGASPGGSFGTPGFAGTPLVGTPGVVTPAAGSDLPSSTDGLTDEGLNSQWAEIDSFFSKPEDPGSMMDAVEPTEVHSQSQKESESPSVVDDAPASVRTPSGLNPVSPALVSTPSGGTQADTAATVASDSVLQATPTSIMSSWPLYLQSPQLPLNIDTVEQYFALCDDSRHDVAMALVFEPSTLRAQCSALLAFCAWCKVQANVHQSRLNLQQHKLSYRLLIHYEKVLSEHEKKLAEQIDNHRNTFSDEALPLTDPLASAIPDIIVAMASLDPSQTSAKYLSRGQRDHNMVYLDIVLPRTRFLELNYFHEADQLGSPKAPFHPPLYDSLPQFSRLSVNGRFQRPDLVDVVSKARLPGGKDCRVCGSCNRVSLIPASSAPAPSSAAAPSAGHAKDTSWWTANWVTRCPCCSGAWFVAY